MREKPKLRVGLIGSGFMGKAHVFGFATAGKVFDLPYEIELHTLADISTEAAARAARDFGFARSTDDWRKLVADPEASHIMNAGYSSGFSVQQVLDAVDRVTNMQIDRRIEGRRAGDPPALIADNSRILATLPWRPQYADLDMIVAHALAWERKLGDRRGDQVSASSAAVEP